MTATPGSSCLGNPVHFTYKVANISFAGAGSVTYRLTNGTDQLIGAVNVQAGDTELRIEADLTPTVLGSQTFTMSTIVFGIEFAAASTSLTVNAPPTAAILTPASTTLTCSSPSLALTATGGDTYRWEDNSTDALRTVTTSGTYSVTVSSASGCTATASQLIGSNTAAPTVSILAPASTTLSCSSPSLSLTAIGGGTYRWEDNSASAVRTVSSSGTYSVTVTSATGCTATASLQVFQDNLTPTLSISPASATLSCATSSVSLSAVGSGTYRWSTGETTPAISATAGAPYSLTLTGTNGCTATATAQVSQDNAPPTVSITPASATLSCATASVSLSAVGSGTYRWSTGATTSSISATLATMYSVTLTSANGCTATASAQVVQDNAVPTVTITATPSLTIGPGQSATLTASGATTYGWNNGANTSVIVVNTGGTYSVTGTSGNGCSATASVVVSQTAPFAIASVIANTCQQISYNRYVISFTPVYAGTNGQPISFSVVNEVFPTTAPGPYTLQLYTDNPTITLKAQQGGTPGEVTYVYNWLAACSSPQPNTPPRVNQPLTDQIARVGEGFGYTLPQFTFTDNESPQSLLLTVSGLPAGLSFTPPFQIGGVAGVTGVSTVTVTATDPQGLSVSTSFRLTVVEPNATNTPPTLAHPIPAQVGIQGQPFTLNVANTFSDAQTPNALLLTANGLPAGLNLVGTLISGTPSVTGTSTVSLTALDPGGLSATTSFVLTIQPASVTASGPFAITGVSPITCTQVANNRYEISFTPRYAGLNGQAI
ncbi:hypothetical protein IC229_02705 [Spirosoma sp. BT702]|uniref:Dystroglycan-type cadherin-like domain-containing protein n=1 Tax=Spirosoma profusum TaxID=2771354 RepID=A0A926Y077_9BACT|nr:putative Ig domain-containing protein [Spirosoma profusum]MBD2699530.1 hypothetical protein [Spirosoma profusum]